MRFSFTLFILLLFTLNAECQVGVASGTIITCNEIVVRNAEVTNKSTGETVKSDSRGFFTISCSSKDKLVIKANGFISRTIKANSIESPAKIDILLDSFASNRELAVINEHISKEELSRAMNIINEELRALNSKYPDIIDMIREKLPEVKYLPASKSFKFYRTTSITGNNPVLLVVDGIVVDSNAFLRIDPTVVISIKALQGPNAAIYGTRGVDGVIEVKTIGKR